MKFSDLFQFDKILGINRTVVSEAWQNTSSYAIHGAFGSYLTTNSASLRATAERYGMEITSNVERAKLYEITIPPGQSRLPQSLNGLVAVRLYSNENQSLILYANNAEVRRFPGGAEDLASGTAQRRNVSGIAVKPYIIDTNLLTHIQDYNQWSGGKKLLMTTELRPGYKKPLSEMIAKHFGRLFAASLKSGKGSRDFSGFKPLTTTSKPNSAQLYFTLCTDRRVRDRQSYVASATAQIRIIPTDKDTSFICGSNSVSEMPRYVIQNDSNKYISVLIPSNVKINDMLQAGDDVLDEYKALVSDAIDPKFIFKKLMSLRSLIVSSSRDDKSGDYKFSLLVPKPFSSVADFVTKEANNEIALDRGRTFRANLINLVQDRIAPAPTSDTRDFTLYEFTDRDTGKKFVVYHELTVGSVAAYKQFIITKKTVASTPIAEINLSKEIDDYNRLISQKYNSLSDRGRKIFMRALTRGESFDTRR